MHQNVRMLQAWVREATACSTAPSVFFSDSAKSFAIPPVEMMPHFIAEAEVESAAARRVRLRVGLEVPVVRA